MHIEEDIKLDFSDVLIRPKRSTLISRKDVDLFRTIQMPHSTQELTYVPVMNANMGTSGTFEIAEALLRQGCLATVHKHYGIEDWQNFLNNSDCNIENLFFPMGMGPEYSSSLSTLNSGRLPHDRIRCIMIDVANGYSQKFIDYVSLIREKFPNFIIAAGNVVTSEMAEALIIAGADMVKCGIGSGCLAGDTRILMSNGTYKGIKDIKVHDTVINKYGKAVEVTGVKFSGYKKVYRYKNNLFFKDTLVTGCHQHWVGDCSGYSETSINSKGHKKLLETPSKNKKESFIWSTIDDDLTGKVLTIPNEIDFADMPETFSISTEQFIMSNRSRTNLNTIFIPEKIKPSYDLGYIVGTFLGDGCSRVVRTIKENSTVRRANTSANVTWYFGAGEHHIAKKLQDSIGRVFNYEPDIQNLRNMILVKGRSNVFARIFRSFYDQRNIKFLPPEWWCKNEDYLKGLLDGMVDSDGSYDERTNRTSFSNTSENLIETYMIAFFIVNGYFPSAKKTPKSNGELEGATLENLKQGYVLRSVKHPSRNITNSLQLNKVFKSPELQELEIPTYDIEVDCPTHSFVANNAIVHNSVCTTRLKAGVGYPQLSAVAGCADAAHGLGGHVISDGGCIQVGDFSKALGAGADIVMSGSFFAGCDESGGEVIVNEDTGDKFCINYGMSSRTAQEKFGDGMKDYRSSEGRTVKVPYVGPVDDVIRDILGGIRSTCTYVGAKKIKELPKRTTFIRVNNTHNRTFENTTIGD